MTSSTRGGIPPHPPSPVQKKKSRDHDVIFTRYLKYEPTVKIQTWQSDKVYACMDWDLNYPPISIIVSSVCWISMWDPSYVVNPCHVVENYSINAVSEKPWPIPFNVDIVDK